MSYLVRWQFLKSDALIKLKINKIMALNIKPLSDRVLIEPVAAETKTASGFLFRYHKEKTKGTVVAVGNGTKEHTMTVKIGDSSLW
jgi:chaperonin GroES